MAKIRAMIGTGGSQPTETVLWTNPSPTSVFGGQTVNLSQSMQNFDVIKIEYENNTSIDNKASIMMSVEDFAICSSSSTSNKVRLSLGYTSGGNINYARLVYYASDTSIEITGARRLNGSGTTDNAAIPTKIIGIKY